MTCHPSFQQHIADKLWRVKRVTYDVNHNLLTSQGPGTALEFAIEIILNLSGKALAWEVAEPMITLPTLHYSKFGEA
jgi:4-methyl-5(b-hydroxyethyl)-thiazole monophosphate biosynthesis